MKRFKLLQGVAAGVAGFGLLLPQVAPAAQLAPVPTAVQTDRQATTVADVALLEGGILEGQVVDAAGTPVAATTVSLREAGHELATAQTEAQGHFSIRGLRGGTYEVSAAGGSGVYRLWAPNSAPPAANSGVLIVSGEQVARGQLFQGQRGARLLMLGVLGGIITAGVITASVHRSGS
jgi:hypothetical protein